MKAERYSYSAGRAIELIDLFSNEWWFIPAYYTSPASEIAVYDLLWIEDVMLMMQWVAAGDEEGRNSQGFFKILTYLESF